MQTSDCIVALGARFDDRVTGNLTKFAPAAKRAAMANRGIINSRGGIFHFDILPKNINKIVNATVAVEGDAATNIEHMLPFIKPHPREGWFEQLQEWKSKYPFTFTPSLPGAALKPQHVIQELDRQVAHLKDKVIITTGVGQHQMWAAQYFRWRHPRTFITSGGLGTMGFGLPAAIGAKVAFPEKIVIDIDGDASLSMTAMELMTARQFDLGVKVLLLNNDFQGMVI
jgi:acetolactate synthase I/II/III large subunit